MSEAVTVSAGALLRQAREQRGLGLPALAASIKVAPRKLEALEADRFDELPDVAFGRALAMAVCRALKIDAAPVLAALPRLPGHRLEQVAQGLNTPYDRRSARRAPSDGGRPGWSPMRWASGLVLLAAAAVYFLPSGWSVFPPTGTRVARPASAAVVTETIAADPAASAAGAGPVAGAGPAAADPAAAPASTVTETVFSVPLEAVAPPASGATASASPAAGASAAAAVVAGPLQLRTSAESWIEVFDAGGQPLLSRTLLPGETVGLDGAMPLRVRIGNAAATDVTFRGQAFALAPHTRENIAKFELK